MYRTETSDERVRPRHRAEKHHANAGGAGHLLPAGLQWPGKTTLCRFMVDARFRQEGLEEKALEHILRG